MELPNCENAYVPVDKLTNYLLSVTHPVGRRKALFLRNLGYDITNANSLMDALLYLAMGANVVEEIPTRWGTKYIVDGLLNSLSGVGVPILTIWIIDIGDSRPRFVTAYPVR